MKLLLQISMLITTLCCYSQADTVVIDRLTETDNSSGNLRNGYYIIKKAGIILSEGSIDNNRSSGRWKIYYANGQLQRLIDYVPFFNGSNYNGVYKEFYENGKIKSDGNYTFTDTVACIDCFDMETKKQIYKADLHPSLRTGTWREFWENGRPKSSGEYYPGVHQVSYGALPDPSKNGVFSPGGLSHDYLKDGEWKYYNENGKLNRLEFYFKGKLVYVED